MEDIEMQATEPKASAQAPPVEQVVEAPPEAPPTEAAVEAEVTTATEEAAAAAPLQAEEEPPTGSDAWFARDREAFIAAHPEVELGELIRDERFRIFCDGKVGAMPLTEIYQGYQALLATFDESAKSLAAQTLANKLASPGRLSGSGTAQSDYYSCEDVRRMSPSEISENYEKIRRSMARW